MNYELQNLPDDAISLKEIIVLQEEKFQERINYLEEMVRLLKNEIFGRKTEKIIFPDRLQRQLFESIEEPEPGPVRVDCTSDCIQICRWSSIISATKDIQPIGH